MRLLTILVLLSTLISCSQNEVQKIPHPFSHLDEIESKHNEGVKLYLDMSKAQVFDKKLNELDKNHPLYFDSDCESNMTLLAITQLDNSGEKYAIIMATVLNLNFIYTNTMI